MTRLHQTLTLERWAQMPLCEQMANIGSEVSRALSWRDKGNEEMSRNACARALELIDLSLNSTKSFTRLKEIARVREAIVDYFYGSNEFGSSEKSWRSYFDHFAYMARKNH